MRLTFIGAGDRHAMFVPVPNAHTVPTEIVPVNSPRKSQDIRITLAYSLFESCGNEAIILLHGTPRSGRTTSLIAESKNRDEISLCIEPTTKIAEETVKDACAASDNKNSDFVINIPSNKKGCLKVREMIEEFPELDHLPIIPLPEKDCTKCAYYMDCAVTRLARTPSDEVDGISLTYHKLVALMLSDNQTSVNTLNKLYKLPKNLILDECHRMETEEMKYVTLIESSRDGDTVKNFDKYNVIGGKGKTPLIIKKFNEIITSKKILKAVTSILEKVKNQNSYEMSPKFQQYQDDFITNGMRAKLIRGFHHEAVKLIKNIENTRLTISDILQIYNMLAVVTARKIQVIAVRDNITGTIEVRIVAADTIFWTQIKAYIQRMQNNRRIILTSGTINGSFDYQSMFRYNTPLNSVIWGKNGDPLNTNSRMHIYADHHKYVLNTGRPEYSLMDNLQTIAQYIKKILEAAHHKETKIVAINRVVAVKLRAELKKLGCDVWVDYYRSSNSIGVRCDARIMITVGIAYQPSNSFDVVTDNADDSYVKLHESVHADTWQMLCRVKDPAGKQKSHVFMIGSNYRECKNVTSWGINRSVRAKVTSKGRVCDVVIGSDKISKPEIMSCYNVTHMIKIAESHGFC